MGDSARRPIKARQSRWAGAWAASLVRRGVSPNAISAFSVACAAVAAGCLIATRFLHCALGDGLLFVGAVVGVQARLVCNLLDGMVAVEGGKSSKAGEIYNDFPDRIADPLILAAAGYAAWGLPFATDLGWAAAAMALLTAYTRVLGHSIGAATHFAGPMAKQHRMALMTAAFVLAAALTPWGWQAWSVWVALVIVVVGCVVTVIRRLGMIVSDLETK